MKLETLSKIVENIETQFDPFSEEDCYHVLKGLFVEKALLDTNLHFGLFVPSKDGVPLDKPKDYDYWVAAQRRGLMILFDSEKECKAYEEAEKLVIFEGWEVQESEHEEMTTVVHGHYEITFSKKYDEVVINGADEKPLELITISDLATATQANPITLR